MLYSVLLATLFLVLFTYGFDTTVELSTDLSAPMVPRGHARLQKASCWMCCPSVVSVPSRLHSCARAPSPSCLPSISSPLPIFRIAIDLTIRLLCSADPRGHTILQKASCWTSCPSIALAPNRLHSFAPCTNPCQDARYDDGVPLGA